MTPNNTYDAYPINTPQAVIAEQAGEDRESLDTVPLEPTLPKGG